MESETTEDCYIKQQQCTTHCTITFVVQ